MILFNTTFSLDAAIENEWTRWVRDVYFTAALDSGFVLKHNLMGLRYETENNGKTYSAQLFFASEEHLEGFLKKHEAVVMNNLSQRFGTSVVYFQTILDVLI